MFTLPKRIKRKIEIKGNPWVFLVLSIVIVIASLFSYVFPNMKLLEQTKKDIVKITNEKSELEGILIENKNKKNEVLQKLENYENKYISRIEKVFPNGEQITELTRFLEDFSLQLEKNGPIEFNTINYPGSKDYGNYSVLPIRFAFQANDINFVRFMQMINNSGSLDEKDFYEGSPVRLMTVNQINVAIPESSSSLRGEEENLYSVNLNVSAFYHN
jgi:hypothetical protein